MVKTSNLTDWLAENPKILGVLWALLLLLAGSGPAVAHSSVTNGP